MCREVNAQGPTALMEFQPPAGGFGNAVSGVRSRNLPCSAPGWAQGRQGPGAPWLRRVCGWCVVTRGWEGALRARAASLKLPYVNSTVAGVSSIQNVPLGSLWPALIHIFPSLLTEYHGHSQGQADQPHRGASQDPQQQGHSRGSWPGWHGRCY